MPTGGNAYMPEGEMEGCDGCRGCDSVSQTVPNPPREQTMAERGAQQEERLETTNLLLGHIAGRAANIAEAIHTTEQGAETRQDEWIELIRWVTEVQQKTQKTGLIVVGCLILVISALTSVVVNLIM